MRASEPASATASGDGFRFIVANDLHHAAEECTPFFERLVEQMRGHGKVAFCLIVGDLADKGRPESIVAIRETFSRLGVPLHAVPGNHDCDLEKSTRVFSEIFPGNLNYHFTHEGWQFVGLDSTDGNNWGRTTIGGATFSFLDEALPKLDATKPTVLFTHFPLLAEVKPELCPVNGADVLARFEKFDLRGVFTGHYHARTERVFHDAFVVTNACCSRVQKNHDGTIPEGYQLCTAHADGMLTRKFIAFAEAEKTA